MHQRLQFRLPTVFVAAMMLSLSAPMAAKAQARQEGTRDESGRTTVRAVRISEQIGIDGRLDEPFYAATLPIDELVQAVPVAGSAPSERTETWIAFDDENLYVSARIWDSDGEAGWIANEMRRDSNQLRSNDSFGICTLPYAPPPFPV